MNQQEVNQLMALFNAGRLSEASNLAEQLRKRNPQSPFLYNILGAIQSSLGNPKAAAGYFGVAVQLKPDYAEALTNLGACQSELGQYQQAIGNHQQAIALQPRSATAHHNLGSAYAGLRHYNKAIECFRRAILAKPEFAKAHFNLGNALRENGQLEESITALDRAIELTPDLAEPHYTKSLALRASGDFEAATACLERALKIRPDYADALSALIFTESYLSAKSPAAQLSRARDYGRLVQSFCEKYAAELPASGELESIGFLTGDWGLHPVGNFSIGFLRALLPRLDSLGIRVALYSNRSEGHHDSLTAEFKALACEWHDVQQLSDQALVTRIREDGVKLLVELSGHTGLHRLSALAARCAPAQATWLGYFATTGLDTMDFIIGDSHVCPPEEEDHFVERVQRMPNSYIFFTPPELDLAVGELPALESEQVTFGCLNHLPKMGEEVARLWADILLAVPDSRLLLKAPELQDQATANSVRQKFSELGVDPSRLDLRGKTDRHAHVATYRDIDIGLDPFPYPGGITSCEAYWMGVPVIVRAGYHYLSHVGESVAHAAGQADWIASDRDDYLAKAIAAAADLNALSELRAGLRDQLLQSPLCDADRFAEDFIAAAREMWAIRLEAAGEQPS